MEFKKLLAVGVAIVGSAAANADTIGFRVDAGTWNQSFDGSVRNGFQNVNLESQLGLDDETNNMVTVYLEHPIPILPNVAVSRTELDLSATSLLAPGQGFTFDLVNYYAGDMLTTTFDLSHTDLTLYYEVLDNWVSLDIGLTARAFDDGVSIQGSRSPLQRSELDIDGTIPMLYVGAKFELPLTGLYAFASANGITYSGSSILDYRASIGYETPIGLGVEAGLRSFEIDYEDDNDSTERADITVDGIYATLFYHF